VFSHKIYGMTNWDEIREKFPVFRKYTYLNSAGGSPMSFASAGEGKRYFDEMLNEGDIPYDEWLIRVEETRCKVADLINATPSEIGFTMNTSSGMNIIALMLNGHGEVLTMKDEFPSSTVAWLNMGYRVRFIDPLPDASYPVDLIEKNIGPDTRIIVTSYVQYCTGFRQDIEALGKLCRKHNLIFVVNATQAIGVMPVDVRKSGIDFMAFSGLKWLTSGYGAGVAFISHQMLEKYKIPVAGWQSTDFPEKMDNRNFNIRQEASVIEAGCPHFPSVLALGGALDMFMAIGMSNIHERIISLIKILRRKTEELGLSVISSGEEKHMSGILIVRTGNAKDIRERLSLKKIIVAARGEGIRVSLSFYNNEDDISAFISEVRTIRELF
jgi:cysteine desulfurase / selenocysteine lyase